MHPDTSTRVDPERLIDGAYIDADLGIVDRTRRNMVRRGDLPEPVGYLGGRARWRLADYLAARARLLESGRPRRPHHPERAA
jgi:hypothetical protein